jgi:hypothetical protein
MTESMQIVIQLAVLQMKMTVEEAITAATLNGAASLGLAAETGSLEAGKRADLVLLAAPSFLHLVYHFGINLVDSVFRNGAPVVRNGQSCWTARPGGPTISRSAPVSNRSIPGFLAPARTRWRGAWRTGQSCSASGTRNGFAMFATWKPPAR